MLEKLPGMGNVAQVAEQAKMGDQFKKMEALIASMTPDERRNPDVLNGSRKRRITKGSGTDIQDLNRLLKQHKQMAKMMKKMKGGGLQKMMRGFGGMMSGGPGGQGGADLQHRRGGSGADVVADDAGDQGQALAVVPTQTDRGRAEGGANRRRGP